MQFSKHLEFLRVKFYIEERINKIVIIRSFLFLSKHMLRICFLKMTHSTMHCKEVMQGKRKFHS